MPLYIIENFVKHTELDNYQASCNPDTAKVRFVSLKLAADSEQAMIQNIGIVHFKA